MATKVKMNKITALNSHILSFDEVFRRFIEERVGRRATKEYFRKQQAVAELLWAEFEFQGKRISKHPPLNIEFKVSFKE
jgi:hypothetical protein